LVEVLGYQAHNRKILDLNPAALTISS
jgi:hypothetical protein